jgi:parvulin-like peptidyl-prolyl isomerase
MPLITAEAFQSRVSEEAPSCVSSRESTCLAVKKQILEQMIDEAILLKLAEKRGLEVSQKDLEEAEKDVLEDYEGSNDMLRQLSHYPEAWRSSLREQLMVQGLFRETLQRIRVDSEDIAAYYQNHRELFVRPREVRVRQIVVARGDEALEILKRLNENEDFATLAETYSLSPEAEEGGDLGFLRPGQMPPELEDVVFSLEVGKVSDVISSPYGFHILRVEERQEPRELALWELESRIRRRLLLDTIDGAYQRWLKEKREEAQIEILDPSIFSGGDRGERNS